MTPQSQTSVVVARLKEINKKKDNAFSSYVSAVKGGNNNAANIAQEEYMKAQEEYRQQVKVSDEILRLENAIRIPLDEMTFEQLCQLHEQGKLKILKTANK